jgi:pyruvate dehydrogenase E2 component (dihydrolipoamide acetyltransferase)
MGLYGVDACTAIINPPEAAILTVGRITDRVIAIDGRPAVRPVCALTLSCDHRVVDGTLAAAFLRDLVEAVENPAKALQS